MPSFVLVTESSRVPNIFSQRGRGENGHKLGSCGPKKSGDVLADESSEADKNSGGPGRKVEPCVSIVTAL